MESLESVRNRIRKAEYTYKRKPGSVMLLAVSKTRPSEDLIKAFNHEQRDFGENYLNEAKIKQSHLANFKITWHFIGPIQSNKTREIASHFSWVHSIDRIRVAARLSTQRPKHLPPLNVCIQVKTSEEVTKSGVTLAEVSELAAAITTLPGLRLRGLMTIPNQASDFDEQKRPFRALRNVLKNLKQPYLDTLSMGMSNDLEAAIAEGATIVRVGTAIFGPRKLPESRCLDNKTPFEPK